MKHFRPHCPEIIIGKPGKKSSHDAAGYDSNSSNSRDACFFLWTYRSAEILKMKYQYFHWARHLNLKGDRNVEPIEWHLLCDRLVAAAVWVPGLKL